MNFSKKFKEANTKRILMFGLVGGLGVIVNTFLLYALTVHAGFYFVVASILATEAAIVFNFFGNNMLTFKDKNGGSLKKRFLNFQFISLFTLFFTVFILWALTTTFGAQFLLFFNLVAIGLTFMLNFFLNSKITWNDEPELNKRTKNTQRRLGGIFFSIFTFAMLAVSPAASLTSYRIDSEQKTITPELTHLEENSTIIDFPETIEDAISEENENQTIENDGANGLEENTTLINEGNVTLNETSDFNGTGQNNETSEGNNILIDSPNEAELFEEGGPVIYEGTAGGLIAVSQLGYHPKSHKQVVVYTHGGNGSFFVVDSGSGENVYDGTLQKALDSNGNEVECQGNNPCLAGIFTSFDEEGEYYISTDYGNSPEFTIDEGIYEEATKVLLEFFQATMQQDSVYHADSHSGYEPAFPYMADGSFILEADQASLSLIRLGSAYNRNPSLLSIDNYDITANGKPDVQEYIVKYVDYLESLQGVVIQEHTDGTGFRLSPSLAVPNAFTVGPASVSSVGVYTSGNNPALITNVPVVSLCGADDESSAWDECADYAQTYYKCQVGEICLNMTYVEKTGTLASNDNGYGVSMGWGYEFGCHHDVALSEGEFNEGYNPCMIFYPEDKRGYTSEALLGFLEALPAVHDYSEEEGKALLIRSIKTYNYIKGNYAAFESEDLDAGFFGAALFLLYDYTGDEKYLEEAHAMNSVVSTKLISDRTRGEEFYWEEYAEHREDITDAGLTYKVGGENPEEFFRGKMFFDWKDSGPNSMDKTSERVFQFDNNVQFQNSRYILTEGVMAYKTIELKPGSESFISVIADNQFAWITGMNAVEDGTAVDSELISLSFIHGIGNFPTKYHSRYLVNTGYKESTDGKIVGIRGTNLQFKDGNNYFYFDGVFNILGNTLGTVGNNWNSENQTKLFANEVTYNNGKKYIPGWISGAFDTHHDTDVIFNHENNVHSWQYTETTNEIVATAIELAAYADAIKNNKPSHEELVIDGAGDGNETKPGNGGGNETNPGNETGQGNETTEMATLIVHSSPTEAEVYIEGILSGLTSANFSLEAGSYEVLVNKTGYFANKTSVELSEGETEIINLTLMQTPGEGAGITFASTNAPFIDGEYHLYETATASFFVNLSDTDEITWTIDEEEIQTTTSNRDTLNWSPGILYTGDIKHAVISAHTGNDSVSWTIIVENVINPFFSDEADEGASVKVNVFTNNEVVNFDSMEVLIDHAQTGTTNNHSLDPFISGNETAWSKQVTGLADGHHYLTTIIGHNSDGTNETYTLDDERVHYNPFPQSSGGGNNGGPNKGGGGSGGGAENIELVYVVLEKDIMEENETQTITLDAKSNKAVKGVNATFISPSGEAITLSLNITNGNAQYGTWSGQLDELGTGLYTLSYIEITGNTKSIKEIIGGRTFYVVGEGVSSNEVLEIVYTTLDKDSMEEAGEVKITLDARDSVGITSVNATVTSVTSGSQKLNSFNVEMQLVNGDANYGTWEGTFEVNLPSTQYKLSEVTLSNGNETKTYKIEERNVYTSSSVGAINWRDGFSGITADAIALGISQAANQQFTPVIVSLVLLALIAFFVFTSSKLKMKKERRGD